MISNYYNNRVQQISGRIRYVIHILSLMAIGYGAQAQVAYINQDSVLSNLPGYTEAKQELATEQQAYNAEINRRKQIWEDKLQKLVGGYNPTERETIQTLKKRMSAVDTLELNLLLAEEHMIQQKIEVYTTVLQETYDKQVQPLLDQLDAIIATYAKEHKLTAIYVLENVSNDMIYVSTKSIITNQIINLVRMKKKN